MRKMARFYFIVPPPWLRGIELPLLLRVYRTFQNGHEGRDTDKSLNWGGMSKGQESSVLKG